MTAILRSLACALLLGVLTVPAEAQSEPSAATAARSGPAPADLLLTGGRVWTGDDALPWVEGVAVRDGWIVATGTVDEVSHLRGPETRVVQLEGRFAAPGFIDNHTHFERAGALLVGVNLLDVADGESLAGRVREAAGRLPDGSWIVGGDWGAYEAWGRGSAGGADSGQPAEPFRPDRALVEAAAPGHPVLLSRWDGSEYLANARALDAAGLGCGTEGVECEAGRPTGRLSAEAAARVRAVIPPKGPEQRRVEALAALERLASHGVTTIHDITGPEMLRTFQDLRGRDELTVRVYARPTLDRVDALAELGIPPGFGDRWLRIGGLKGFVDGIMGNSSARFYEPYRTSGEHGRWRTMMEEPPGMLALLRRADSLGFEPEVHAIGDQAIDTLLSMFEQVIEEGPERERRFRVIHAQVLRGPEVARRMARLGVVAEVQPYHAIDDMRWMEERIGERARWAYAFRTLQDAGVLLSFGSDWPGTNASWYPSDPLLGMYAAVNRRTLEGEPGEGWFPEERVDIETALRAYTVNNARAAGEDEWKGRVAPGMVADLVVLDRNPFEIEAMEIREARVLITIVGGRVVHGGQGGDDAAR